MDNINVTVKSKNPAVEPKSLKELTAEMAEVKGTIVDINASVEQAEQDVERLNEAYNNSDDFIIGPGNKMKRKPKAYAPAEYSGLGEIYLDKNMKFLGREFEEFVSNPNVPHPGESIGDPDGIVYDRVRQAFLGYRNYEGSRIYTDTWDEQADYTAASGYKYLCTSTETAYKWQNGDLVETVAINGNVLTQAMLDFEYTIYHIQYDYDLNGRTIEVPDGCVLEFEGGSLNNGSLTFNTTRLSGEPKIYTNLSGLIENPTLRLSWFGFKPGGSVDNAPMFEKLMGLNLYNKELLFEKIDGSGGYYISRTITVIQSEITFTGFTTRHYGGQDVAIYSDQNITLLRLKGSRYLINGLCFYTTTGTHKTDNTIGIHFGQVDDADLATETNGSKASIDSEVRNCLFHQVNNGIYLAGNQIRIKDCGFTSNNVCIKLNTLSNEEVSPLYYGSTGRSCIIDNCNFHSMDVYDTAINILTELYIGVIIRDCHVDCELNFIQGPLFRSIVQNNFVSNLQGYCINGKCKDTIISGNTFLGDLNVNHWYSDGIVRNRANPSISGSLVNTIISNNYFGETSRVHIYTTTTNNSSIIGNIFKRWGSNNSGVSRAAIQIGVAAQYGVIISNNQFYQEGVDGSYVITFVDDRYFAREFVFTNNSVVFDGTSLTALIAGDLGNNLPFLDNNYIKGELHIVGPNDRPIKGAYKSVNIFDRSQNRPLWYDGTTWRDAIGIGDSVNYSGTWANRPTDAASIFEGFQYMINDGSTHLAIFAHISGDPATISWYKADGTQYTGE